MIDQPLAEYVVEEFLEILDLSHSNRFDELLTKLNSLEWQSVMNCRKFLLALIDTNADIVLEWGSPNPNKGRSVCFSLNHAYKTVEQIDEVEPQTLQESQSMYKEAACPASKEASAAST